jgi:hypothetical protein
MAEQGAPTLLRQHLCIRCRHHIYV